MGIDIMNTPKDEYYAGKGCTCGAYGRHECGCDVDWTDGLVYILMDALMQAMNEWYAVKNDLSQAPEAHWSRTALEQHAVLKEEQNRRER